jgi:hypothetical protein
METLDWHRRVIGLVDAHFTVCDPFLDQKPSKIE